MSQTKKVVIVTGASRGIGAAVAQRLAGDGWSVAVNYRSGRDAAESVVARIVTSGGEAIAVPGDVSREVDVLALFDAVLARWGRLDGLVNNAGRLDLASSFADISLERWERMFATNTTGTFLCAREAVRRMSREFGGSIVNISSMAALLGGPGEFVDYAASKGAVDALTLGLAKEVGPRGIRVNAVRPGLIDTEMQAASGDPDRAIRLVGAVPLRRIGLAIEVADAVAWLLSPQSSYVTGSTVTVSGGR